MEYNRTKEDINIQCAMVNVHKVNIMYFQYWGEEITSAFRFDLWKNMTESNINDDIYDNNNDDIFDNINEKMRFSNA